jgi:hypothetical protein
MENVMKPNSINREISDTTNTGDLQISFFVTLGLENLLLPVELFENTDEISSQPVETKDALDNNCACE